MRTKSIAIILLSLSLASKTMAQFSQELPADLLDKNSSVYYSFHLGETHDQKASIAKMFTDFLIKDGFNLMKEEEKKRRPSVSDQYIYNKENDSLAIVYEITLTSGTQYSVILTNLILKKTIEWTGLSYGRCAEAFYKDFLLFKQNNPTINQVPFEATALSLAKNRKVSGHRIDEAGYPTMIAESPYNFINKIPDDIASSTLVVLLYDELEVDSDEALELAPADLEKRRARTIRLKNKNIRYKEQFSEYPYPIVFALPEKIDSLCEVHHYLLIDVFDNSLVSKDGFSNGRPTHSSVYRTFHNFSFRDNKNSNTYYRLDDWTDCEKGGDVFCFNRFIKGILSAQKK